jgi:predicted acylesterase/phospholipase RssA
MQERIRHRSPEKAIIQNVLLILGLVLMLALNGCYAKIYQLPAHPDKNTPVFPSMPDQKTLVGVAVSGGGSRAATFAAGALEALADVRIVREGKERSVLETVTHMSSVSGGSLATAYYAMKKPPKSEAVLAQQGLTPTYQQFFTSFKSDMQKNFEWPAFGQQMLKFRGNNPTKMAYSFAEVWDDEFFNKATFSGLFEREQRGDAPRIIFNGTIYNSGRRLAMTTLPPSDFAYDFTAKLSAVLDRKKLMQTKEGQESLARIERAKNQFLPQTFEDIQCDHLELLVSRAVATSASFPPFVGPVTYQAEGANNFTHVGDGGLFDNLGTESLTSLFLNKLETPSHKDMRGLILVIDASYPFDAGAADLDKRTKGFSVFRNDPSRIVGIMEERANAYQAMLWHSLRAYKALLPDNDHLKIILLRHTEKDLWTKDDAIPADCPTFQTVEEIEQTVRQVPTLFRIKDDCHAALLIATAHKAVARQRHLIVKFLEGSP